MGNNPLGLISDLVCQFLYGMASGGQEEPFPKQRKLQVAMSKGIRALVKKGFVIILYE